MTSVQTSEPFPLSSLQRAYFTGRQAGLPLHAPARYGMEFRVDALDRARLQGALRLVIERHDALRTIVDARGEGVVRLHVPELAIEERDLRAADDPTAALRRQRDALMEAERPLSSWPLFQVVALRLSDREWRVQFAFELMFMDGVSMTNFFRELSTLYETPQAEMDEIGFSLAEHARQRARGTGSARVQRALAYWEERVATLPFGPQLPLRGDAALRTRSRLIRRRAELDETQWAGLREACRKADVSVPAALATAYTDVLGYFGREPRFSVSVMLQQRPPEAALALGSFASTVPLLVNASELDDFGARARSTQRRLTEALMHSDVSGVEIAQRMLRHRSQALTIPFPAAFVATLQPERDEPLRRTPFAMEGAAMVWSELRTPQVVLDHQATETPEGRLRVYWDASEDALCPGVAEDMFSVYLTHLRQLSDAAWGQKRAGVTLPAHQKLQREAVNSTAGERDWRLLHEPFWNQVERRPDRVCLVEGSVRLAYAALGRIVNAGTQRLLASGVQPGDRVALVMHKGWEQIAGALAVLGAGAVYVPIDASAPAAWRCRVLERCGVKMALTQPRTDDVGGWPHAVERCVLTESVDPAVTLERPLPRARLDDLAYIIFTSGSTGEPKGVMIDHRGAFNTIADINRRFGVSERDALLGVSSFSFDLSVYDAFGLLAAGGTVVLPPSSAPTPGLWLELLRAEKITV